MDSSEKIIRRTQDAQHAARTLIRRGITRTPPTPLWGEDPALDLDEAVTDVLEPFLAVTTDAQSQLTASRTGRQSWISLDGQRAAAALSLTLRRVEPGDPEYAYLPPAYAALGMAGTLADRRTDLPALLDLFRTASSDIRAAGIEQVTVQIHSGDWMMGSFWRELGFRPDSVLAARTSTTGLVSADDVDVRVAHPGDVDALIEMSRQEQDFRALHTRTGSVARQSMQATRDTVISWLADSASAPTLVAQDPKNGQWSDARH